MVPRQPLGISPQERIGLRPHLFTVEEEIPIFLLDRCTRPLLMKGIGGLL